ncbi:hydroxyethylthiazole kinase-like uncharacterized protein yjeF [Breznakia sp. PF5-3]|uniref:NAD(P)H-hydrate dehydratase n=1 Tax=unclassified Breznakia TaxID=2623764 RepID=UPI0024070037|nr:MULTISPECIES: NAD(P)H-hydrate dehydratase [unclassified Breznakia]MDF9824290.1 hydroxyethylthiazole kinase-like uncharacterized protein yjeF [Breznakia sp. PM6-1]MDF9835514.1 hydroxyethylthiazole kinase-like uncharacterized protein yjeF [Breznakia sp. PF5-3]MDF9838012.1 hydroxyethylthiazole kinase-like uncharacterized protein yjeF [Breznakia sp. PFB2-8]MDF9859390.1 hydroxyethylthiazole kinase-like uncharacterized protein yjeF [Breznakia sp. PH5-24]
MKLVNAKQMRQIDEAAIHKYQIPSLELMENAGQQVYESIIQLVSKKDFIGIVCGIGNNAGDGFVVARKLYDDGYNVEILSIGEEANMSLDCKVNYNKCTTLRIPFVDCMQSWDVVIDAIFGTGLSRNVEGAYASIIEKINALSTKVISIDIASGIDAATGHILGSVIKADYTLTLQTGKIGLYMYPGRIYSGHVEVLDIGIPQQLIDEMDSTIYLIEKKDMKSLLPSRSIHSNKGTYGKVLCVGGSMEMSGAISLAALAALRSGCGMITCAVPKCIKDVVACNVLESMRIILSDINGHIDKQAVIELKPRLSAYSCLLIGCGIGRSKDIEAVLEVLLDSELPLVIDADGIFALKSLLPKYKERKNIIITPHLMEFARLVDKDIQEIIDNPIQEALAFTERYPYITLVLKSETSLVVQNRKVYVNTYGNNGLAKGGSGDVLAGIITGLYAQNKDALAAATLGVFLHAYSADVLLNEKTLYSMIPSDIFMQIDDIIKSLEEDL